MEVVGVVMFVLIAVSIPFIQAEKHKRSIIEKIHSIDGEVICVEKKMFYTGPFVINRRGRTIYLIKYKTGSEVKEGWVMFGNIYGPDWRL